MGRVGWNVGLVAVVVACSCDDGMRRETVEDAVEDAVEEDDGIDVVRLGVIDFHGEIDDDVIVMPDSVRAGVAFTLRIHTYNSPCDKQESVDVEYGDGQVVVSPYVHTLIPRGTVCADALLRLEHAAEIVLEPAGEHTIVVRGRRLGDFGLDEEITREVRVVAE